MQFGKILMASLACMLVFGSVSAPATAAETSTQQVVSESDAYSGNNTETNTETEVQETIAQEENETKPKNEDMENIEVESVINETSDPQNENVVSNNLSEPYTTEDVDTDTSSVIPNDMIEEETFASYKPALKEGDGILQYYDETGKASNSFTGFMQKDSSWFYVKNGKVDLKTTDIIKGAVNGKTAQWYVVNSKVTAGPTVAHGSSGWLYIDNEGKVNTGFTGFAKNSNGWWYVKNGKVDFRTTGIIKGVVNGKSAQWNVVGNKVTAGPTVAHGNSGWFYIDNEGKINTGFTGFAKNSNGWWYVKKGKVDFKTTDVIYGKVNGKNAWWNVVGNKVTAGPTVSHNSNGWWYINKTGCVDFNYNGFARNKYGNWYCKNGKVGFNVTNVIKGTVNGKSGWWYVKGNKVTGGPTVQKNSNGWWYIDKTGKVDFSYTGVAHNQNGWWYCKNGKVRFNYTGFGKNQNGTWYCTNGTVTFSQTNNYYGTVNGNTGWWFVRSGKVIGAANGKQTSNYLTRRKGVVYFNGHRETFYSQRVLSGSGLRIPGRHVSDMDGTIRDKDDYICIASNDYSKGTVIRTSLGYGKIYDSGCASGTIDVYCNW